MSVIIIIIIMNDVGCCISFWEYLKWRTTSKTRNNLRAFSQNNKCLRMYYYYDKSHQHVVCSSLITCDWCIKFGYDQITLNESCFLCSSKLKQRLNDKPETGRESYIKHLKCIQTLIIIISSDYNTAERFLKWGRKSNRFMFNHHSRHHIVRHMLRGHHAVR